MDIPLVDLKAQYKSIKEEVDEAIQRVVDNTAFIGGEEVLKFRNKFEELYGVKHCIPCSNGTDAIYIALKMLDVGQGDEVITTATSWISTSETITQTGAKPVFVDIHPDYYTIDPAKIEEKITSNTKAIIPVHLYGQMANMPAIMEIAEEYDLKVIEDSAQAHFAELDGKKAGLWGDVGTFSFYPGKNLGAYGDAGCIVTNDEDLAEKCYMYANHGALQKHHHKIEGINSRLNGLQAAVLSVKLDYIQEWTQKRIEIARQYSSRMQHLQEIKLPRVRKGAKHVFHVYAIRIKNRNKIKEFLCNKGISARIHYPKAMPFMEAYERFSYSPRDFPNAYNHQDEELSIPIYPELDDNEIRFIIENLEKAVLNS